MARRETKVIQLTPRAFSDHRALEPGMDRGARGRVFYLAISLAILAGAAALAWAIRRGT